MLNDNLVINGYEGIYKVYYYGSYEYNTRINRGYELVINKENIQGYTRKDFVKIKFYYLDGQYHNENGPAIIDFQGNYSWYLNDKKHRIGGPAVKHNGFEYYYLDNKRYKKMGMYNNVLLICRFCKYQGKDKTDLLVHYDMEEERNNIIHLSLRSFLQQ